MIQILLASLILLLTGDWTTFRGDAKSTGFAEATAGDRLEVVWKFEMESGGFESAANIVKQDNQSVVYAAGITNKVEGRLFAIDLDTGEKIWQFDSPDGFLTTPAYDNGRLYLGDMLGRFFCVDSTGKEVWNFKTDVEINSSANLHGDHVLFGSQDATLYALDKSSGELAWKLVTDDQLQCSVTVADDTAFLAGCDSRLHVVDLNSGTEKGFVEIGSPTIATPAVADRIVYFGNEKGDFFAIDWQEKKAKWTHSDPKGGNSFRSSAAIAKGHVVVGARNRRLTSFHPETGEENWSVTLKNKVDSSPVIVGNRVIAASTDGRLYLVDLTSGELLQTLEFNGSFKGSPAFAHDRLIIGTDDGVLICLKFVAER